LLYVKTSLAIFTMVLKVFMISDMTFRICIRLNVLVTSFTIRKKDFMILRMVFYISLCYDFFVTKYAMILQLCRVIHDLDMMPLIRNGLDVSVTE